jgi:uncharacterized protein (DUF58 family)
VNRLRESANATLQALTPRGRSFLAAGGAALVCSLVLGQRDLLRVAILVLALPVLSAVIVRRARYRLALNRTITPMRVVAGTTARVRLELDNLARVSTRVLLAEDKVPYALGAAPRFVLDRLSGGRRAAVTYSLRSEVRGRFEIGPLTLRLTDAFGLCELVRSFTATDSLIVVPRTWPLAPVQAGGMWATTGDSVVRTVAVTGEDDVSTREYQHGDDLRRVHWRSTARHGELMVRTDEQPRQMRATVLVDSREVGHRGDGPASSLEWAVSAAASVAVLLAGHGYGVRILTDSRPAAWTSPGPGQARGSGSLLDMLAVLRPTEHRSLDDAIRVLSRGGGDGLVVAVLGETDVATARALAHGSRGGGRGIAMVLRTTAWAQLPPGRAATIDTARREALRLLDAGGWLVGEASPDQSVTQVWEGIVAPGADPGSGVSLKVAAG